MKRSSSNGDSEINFNGSPGVSDLSEEIAEDEKREILAQIETAMAETGISPVAGGLRARKKGLLLPLLINAAALAAIVGVAVVALAFYSIRQMNLALEARRYFSTEAKLLEAFKAEAEKQLREKDATIFQIYQQLEEFGRKRSEINELVEINILTKDRELAGVIDAQLESTAARLKEDGVSESEIREKVSELERELEANRSTQLELYQQDMQEIVVGSEKGQSGEQDLVSELRAKAARERERLEQDLAAREQVLRAELAAAEQEARGEVLDLEYKLETLAGLRAKELDAASEIDYRFAAVLDRIADAEALSALEDLTELKRFLTSKADSELPAVASRLDSDLSLARALEELIAARAASSDAAVRLQTAENNLLLMQKQAARLQLERREETEETARLQSRMSGQANEITRLKRSAAVAEQSLEEAAGAVKSREYEIDRLEKRQREEQESKARGLEEMSSLQRRLETAETRVSTLRGQMQEGNSEIDRMRREIAEEQTELADMKRAMATMKTEMEMTSAVEKSAQGGRASTFQDVLALIAARSGAEGSSPAGVDSRTAGSGEHEPLLREVAESLQTLLENRAARERQAARVEYKLLGTVVLVVANRIVIEAIPSVNVTAGAEIEIRGVAADGELSVVARGEITEISGTRVRARITVALHDDRVPAVRDMCYLAVPPSQD